MRILFVEDNEDLREVMAEVMIDEGCEVVACAGAAAAERAFAPDRFDLLLTDVGLPGVTGLELAGRLRARQPDLWVAFLSGSLLDDLAAWGPRTRAFMKPLTGGLRERLLAEVLSSETPQVETA
jgi:CheY-like chemotaxis protein